MKLYPVVRFTVRGEADTLRCTDCHTVIYDGTCVVCGRLVTALRRLDRRVGRVRRRVVPEEPDSRTRPRIARQQIDEVG